MTSRLSERTLRPLPPNVGRPTYVRAKLKPGVVHIGMGAFHRAHQAPLFHALADAGDIRWGVVGASLRSASVRDALRPQDWLYSLAVEDGGNRETTVIGTIRDVIVAPENPRQLVEAVASPATQIVTVTVTEKGYRLDPESGRLMKDDEGVRADMNSLETPTTMPGYLAAGLSLRMERGLPPIAVLSCDNLAGNGRKLRDAVVRLAGVHDPNSAEWILQDCAFPNSMVDRIVPAATEADITEAANRLGVEDLAPVRTEAFSQWVIEDRLVGMAGELARVGVQLTNDLAPWEKAKLRLLNGAHSAMAYLGGLAEVETVDGFVRQPANAQFVQMLWDELEPTLAPPPELNLSQYRQALMGRFNNAALRHRLRQIAADGSQKITQRLLAPAAELLDRGTRPDAIALAIAAWMCWQCGRTDAGETFEVDDPMASTTARLVAGERSASDLADGLLSLRSIFPERLSSDATFRALVEAHLDDLRRLGARATLERFVAAERASSSRRYRA